MEDQSDHKYVEGSEELNPLHFQDTLVNMEERPQTYGERGIMQDAFNKSEEEEMLLQNLDYDPINTYTVEKVEETRQALSKKSQMQEQSSALKIHPSCGYEQLSLKLQEAMKRIQNSQHCKQFIQEKKRFLVPKQFSLNQPLSTHSNFVDTQNTSKQGTPLIIEQKKARIPSKRIAQHLKKEAELVAPGEKKQIKRGLIRSNHQFIQSQMEWEDKKQRKLHEQLAKEKQMITTSLTFTPQINSKSKALAKRRGDELPLYQREAKPKKLLPDPECTFHPNTGKNRK